MKRLMTLIAAVVLLAAGCGGDSDDPGVASVEDLGGTTTTATASDSADSADEGIDEEKVLAFAACMRDGGIDFPDPVVGSDGNVGFDLLALGDLADVDDDELVAAFEPCAYLLEGVNFGFDRFFDADFQDDLVGFAACMRDNGIDMPDPDFSGLTDGQQLFPGFDTELDDPDFEVAFEACEDQLPGIPGIAGG